MRSNKLRLQIVLEMYVMGVVKEKEKKHLYFVMQKAKFAELKVHTGILHDLPQTQYIFSCMFVYMCIKVCGCKSSQKN